MGVPVSYSVFFSHQFLLVSRSPFLLTLHLKNYTEAMQSSQEECCKKQWELYFLGLFPSRGAKTGMFSFVLCPSHFLVLLPRYHSLPWYNIPPLSWLPEHIRAVGTVRSGRPSQAASYLPTSRVWSSCKADTSTAVYKQNSGEAHCPGLRRARRHRRTGEHLRDWKWAWWAARYQIFSVFWSRLVPWGCTVCENSQWVYFSIQVIHQENVKM